MEKESFVFLTGARTVKAVGKGVLVAWLDREIWLPQARVIVSASGVAVPAWLAAKEGLEAPEDQGQALAEQGKKDALAIGVSQLNTQLMAARISQSVADKRRNEAQRQLAEANQRLASETERGKKLEEQIKQLQKELREVRSAKGMSVGESVTSGGEGRFSLLEPE